MTIKERAPMRDLIPSSDRIRNTVWLAAKALLICWLVLLSACTTAHPPGAQTRGYAETQLARNVFAVRVRETARPSNSKATELCLLRCAEVTLAHGFRHFVVLENAEEQQTTRMDDLGPRSTRPRDADLSFINSEAGSPSSANTVACFRTQPAGYPEAYDAGALFSRLADRYGVRMNSEAPTNVADALPLQFKLNPSFLLLSRTAPEQVVFLEPNAARRTIVIGVLNDWENPCATLDEFKRKAALAAAILGGQAVQIQSHTAARRGGSGDFGAALLLIPKARLGLEDEGGQWPRTELVVRGFDQESLASGAGLKVGDRIVALNGVDVLQEKRFADAWLSWSIGESVVVTFVRGGIQMSLQAQTIAN
jgi:hypothetical protein